MSSAIIDANVIVAEFDEHDSLHKESMKLVRLLRDTNSDLIYLDCVVNEVFSVITKRFLEQRRLADMQNKLTKIKEYFLFDRITQAYPLLSEYYEKIIQKIITSNGKLNFHDALIVIFADKENIQHILSFDQDFDGVPEITRLHDEDSIKRAFKRGAR